MYHSCNICLERDTCIINHDVMYLQFQYSFSRFWGVKMMKQSAPLFVFEKESAVLIQSHLLLEFSR